jgi:1,4-alpha-glucan branching enzyme
MRLSAGDDEILKESGIKYFFVDSHGVLHGTPRPKYGVFAPVYCKSGVACFARDMESSKQVWSSVEGYPGDYYYREFYRDIGFDLDYDYIRPYIHPDGIPNKRGTNNPYHGADKKRCRMNPEAAREKAAAHAATSCSTVKNRSRIFTSPAAAIIISPYADSTSLVV